MDVRSSKNKQMVKLSIKDYKEDKKTSQLSVKFEVKIYNKSISNQESN